MGLVLLTPDHPPSGLIVRRGPPLPALLPPPMHPGHSLQEHWKKNHVHADERRPKMYFAPEIVHLSAGRLGEPVINAGEKPEDCARRNDVMEMRDDVIGVVQIKVG